MMPCDIHTLVPLDWIKIGRYDRKNRICYICSPYSTHYPTGVRTMEEILCNVELVKENNDFVVRIQSDLGGVREYKSMNFEEVLDQMVQDLQEEFETF